MGAGLRLELRQHQQLTMTPQLQQAIKLLQMSSVELAEFVAAEVERNPLLSTEAPPDPAPQEPEAEAPPPAEAGTDARLTAEGDLSLVAETFDTGTENLYDAERAQPLPGETSGLRGAEPRARGAEDTDGGQEARLSRPTSLADHLLAQIGQMRAPEPLPAVAAILVHELDEAGYLRTPLEEIAARLSVSAETAAAALALVQRCEPTGVGARSLAECLSLQLAERNRLDPAIALFLDNLELLERGQVDRLARLCGVGREDVADMLADLRCLDPRPGAGFDAPEPETLIPDVFVRPARWGGWEVELNADALPTVLLDTRYATALSAGGAEARAFLGTCREKASWLIKSLDQRARTILKVATEIVRQQEGFLAEGPRGLRPMSLRMVADAIGMHESTVSRVTSKKYMSTERGIFELKFFFSNAVGGRAGGGDGAGACSAEAVRSRVRDLVAAETAEAVLSDDQIVEILKREGVEIARRTVAKYRSSLGIPSSVERRRRLALG